MIWPFVVTRPIAGVVPWSVNQRSPPAPPVISNGRLPEFSPAENSVIFPLGVIRPIAGVLPASVNQMSPSGPTAIA